MEFLSVTSENVLSVKEKPGLAGILVIIYTKYIDADQ